MASREKAMKDPVHNSRLQLAYDFVKYTGRNIYLTGKAGTGKTTFTQAFARAIGISESVGSPTFKLISEYEGTNLWLYHIDCYRLECPQQFINIGGEEYLENTDGVTLIEWADIIEEVLPKDTINIKFNRLSDNTEYREITIEK